MVMPEKVKSGDDALAIKKDWISSLPDHILADILSCLPTKDAVATTLLSKRWRNVYTGVTRLDFDNTHLNHSPRLRKAWDRYFREFEHFVDDVLHACQSKKITTFKFYYSPRSRRSFPDMRPSHLDYWMCFPLTRGVEELDFSLCVKNPGKLPWAIFNCPTLEVLKLFVNLDIEIPLSLGLQNNLKELYLTSCHFPNDGSLTRLVSSCTSLQLLTLFGICSTLSPLEISSRSLRRLTIRFPYSKGSRSKLALDVPNLENLMYIDSRPLINSSRALNALVEAEVEFVGDFLNDNEIGLDLLATMSNVQHLHLMENYVMGLNETDASKFRQKLPVFRNLKHLELDILGTFASYNVLMELLNKASFLEKLIFPKGIINTYLPGYREVAELECESWRRDQIMPSCLKSHLKRIVIHRYKRTKCELEMVKYFLRNALVLEELVVVCAPNWCAPDIMTSADGDWLFSTLQKLPTASMSCSIKIE